MKTKKVFASFFYVFFLLSFASCERNEEPSDSRWSKKTQNKVNESTTNKVNVSETIEGERKKDTLTIPPLEVIYCESRHSKKDAKRKYSVNPDRALCGIGFIKSTGKIQPNSSSAQGTTSNQKGEPKTTDGSKRVGWYVDSSRLIMIGAICFLIIHLLLLFLLFIKLGMRKSEIRELFNITRKLQEKIKELETKSSSVNKDSSLFSSSTLGSSMFNEGHRVGMPLQPAKQPAEKKPPAPPPDLISPLYADKKGRDERKVSGESDVFLDIASVMYTKMQRNEHITSVLLEKQGTWRNSMFVLSGQSLYINFHLYNETRSFSFETENVGKLLQLIYDVQGEGKVITCTPATVNVTSDGYYVMKKGKLILA